MNIIDTDIPDVKIVEPNPFIDHRGFFVKFYKRCWFEENISNLKIADIDHSGSYHNVLRGLHYQINNPQGKFITAGVGEVFDVAVDLRKSSPTFGKWVSTILTAENKRQIWIPPGFAHGFYTLSAWAEIFYMTTEYHYPEYDRSLLWSDKDININWPIPEGVVPVVSAKDANGKALKEADLYD